MNSKHIQMEMIGNAIAIRAALNHKWQAKPFDCIQYKILAFHQKLTFTNKPVTNALIHTQLRRSIASPKVAKRADLLISYLMTINKPKEEITSVKDEKGPAVKRLKSYRTEG